MTSAIMDAAGDTSRNGDSKAGLLAGITAYTIWGFFPVYFVLTRAVTPPAIFFLGWLSQTGQLQFGQLGPRIDSLLILAGPITVLPLLAFAYAARHITLSMLGILQYIGPTLQFALGIYFGEAFTTAHALCFGFIWLGIIIYSYDALKIHRQKS